VGDSFTNPIQTTHAPFVIWRQAYCPTGNTNCNPAIYPGGTGNNYGPSNCPFNAQTRYCKDGLFSYGDNRSYPPGFYEYWNDYNSGSTPYAIVSGGLVLVKTNDGGLIALESGNPLANAKQNKTIAQGQQTEHVLGSSIQVIDWQNAEKYVGQNVSVEGIIASAVNHRPKAVYLGFKNPHDGALLVRVFEKDLYKFSYDPMTLQDKHVKIIGFVTLYWPEGKDAEIIVTDPNQITIMR
jgi:hypothetical protein